MPHITADKDPKFLSAFVGYAAHCHELKCAVQSHSVPRYLAAPTSMRRNTTTSGLRSTTKRAVETWTSCACSSSPWHGADVDLPDVWGVTPMYQAACSGQVQCIHLLVRAGARINYKNKKTGEAPKQLSVRPALLNWLESLLREPHSLKHQCRQVVHRALGPARIWALGSLPLPPAIRDYLMFQDLQIPDSTGLGPSEDQAFG
ncbi:ankyrin repeat and SOCS box protein 7-like isoform X2 [Paramormyrops kingsleyae]|uniref:ankyrin repeat and SOCS box protein 7-like isoform X2 n=1 Tax=Paramormyrops kingsleyae TaxID=1676925 RepID=UPI000CD5DF90|nr:ankyrin repeat and SOCS box protein 7-like isoform X4 [Paramormyrops kingsleyae]